MDEFNRIPEYGFPQRPPQGRRPRLFNRLHSGNPRLNYGLFLATCVTTFLTGWLQNGYWQAGLWYGGAIIAILLAHEMGHYLMCRRYGIQATLPFFIPFPPFVNPFGTLGAVIRMESVIPSRKALFDVAVAGPLAGLALTIPAIYFGIKMSTIIDLQATDMSSSISLGESFLFAKLSQWAIGALPEHQDVLLHPLAYAGWAGLFVTALNLLPIGQLDGGHVIYALFGRRHTLIAGLTLAIFGVMAIFFYSGWILLLLLLLWFGHRHPPTLDDRPIDRGRVLLGVITLILFALSFTPEPFQF